MDLHLTTTNSSHAPIMREMVMSFKHFVLINAHTSHLMMWPEA